MGVHGADGNQSLRTTLQIAHTAVSEAALEEHDRIGVGLIETAIAAWAAAAELTGESQLGPLR